jgi:hypothetical protein
MVWAMTGCEGSGFYIGFRFVFSVCLWWFLVRML